jgi:hypothetical protein
MSIKVLEFKTFGVQTDTKTGHVQILLVSDIGLMTNGEGCNNILKLSFENVYKKDILKEINCQVMCATPDNIIDFSGGRYLLKGHTPIEEFNEFFNVKLQAEDVDTVLSGTKIASRKYCL